jgi:hypothetical protein
MHRSTDRGIFLLTECKASSFGTESTSAEQGRTYLILAGPNFSQVLGLDPQESPEAIVLYLTNSEAADLLCSSLSEMSAELDKSKLAHGSHQCMGLELKGSCALLHLSSGISNLMGIKDIPPIEVLSGEEGSDPRPLYFIPYDPGIDQSPEERKFCRRILFERIQGAILSRIGQGIAPSRLSFTTEDLLGDAMFGMYQIWEDNATRSHMRKLANSLINDIHKILPEDTKQKFYFSEGTGWVVDISSDGDQQRLLNLISRFKVDTVAPSDLRQLTLDDMPGQIS